jgi:starvation-inducible DNA-binding protein
MLVDNLKVLLASSYVFVLKAQNFHYNVEGPDFPQYHKFFGKLYEEVYDNTIDKSAELIRVLGSYTPSSLLRFSELSIIADQTKIPRAELMIQELLQDNNTLLNFCKETFTIAEQENEQGICDFIASRIDAHGKWNWMLRSILKTTRA